MISDAWSWSTGSFPSNFVSISSSSIAPECARRRLADLAPAAVASTAASAAAAMLVIPGRADDLRNQANGP